jgi:hypothetical protein
MLLERAAGLAEKIDVYQKLRGAANQAELFSTRAKQVGEAAALVAQARAALDRFSKAGIAIKYCPASVAELTDKATELRAIAAENPAGLANPPFNIKHEFTDRLKSLATAAKGSIEEGWRRYVTENGPSGSDEVLEALGRLPQMRAGVMRIRQCRQNVAFLAATVPVEPERAIEQLRELTEEHGSAWTMLTADNVPPSVLQFLRACAADGAPITAFTDEVRDWLESRELLGSFRIRIS